MTGAGRRAPEGRGNDDAGGEHGEGAHGDTSRPSSQASQGNEPSGEFGSGWGGLGPPEVPGEARAKKLLRLWDRPTSIRSRLLLLVMALLLPSIAAALWVLWQTWTAERHGLERHLRDTTSSLSVAVDRELAHRAVIARVLALSRTFDGAPEISPEQMRLFEMQARRAMQGLQGWVEILTTDFELLSTRQPMDQAGTLTFKSRPPGAPALANRPLVGAIERRQGVPPHVEVVHPIEQAGRPVLNVVVTVVPSELQALIAKQNVPGEWRVAILDSSRQLVASRAPPSGSIAADDLLLRNAVLDEKGGALREVVASDGTPLTVYSEVSPQGWFSVAAVPSSALLGSRRKAVLPVAIGAIVLLGLGVAGAMLVSRRIAIPVDSLRTMAENLRVREPVQPPVTTGIVECDAVARVIALADATIRRNRHTLQLRVDEAILRTRETEQRAAHSQRSEALGRLTGGVAHDFNNLLSVISNNAHLIAGQPEGQSQRLARPLAAILRSVENGSRLTQHLLRFAGRQPIRPKVIDLGSFFAEVRELLRTVLGKRVELEMRVEPGTPGVRADASELELALINIGLNARDAIGGSGHVQVSARLATAEECFGLHEGSYVLLQFSDDGCGIPPDLLERVVEPFFTTKGREHGTGLGLSQVQGFCEQAGGELRVESEQGVGTTLSLLLPASRLPAEPPAARPSTDLEFLGNCTLLLVEDNDELGIATAEVLAASGCTVHVERNARSALEWMAQGGEPDIVLSDVMVPGDMDGLALARALRSLKPDLPIVLISGYPGMQSSTNEFLLLQKPCEPAELLQTLRRALRSRPVSRA